MGVYFETPVRQAVRRWKVMQVLGENGYKFQTEGSKSYIESYFLITKNPMPERVKAIIEFRKQESIESKIKERLGWEKKFWRKQK